MTEMYLFHLDKVIIKYDFPKNIIFTCQFKQFFRKLMQTINIRLEFAENKLLVKWVL